MENENPGQPEGTGELAGNESAPPIAPVPAPPEQPQWYPVTAPSPPAYAPPPPAYAPPPAAYTPPPPYAPPPQAYGQPVPPQQQYWTAPPPPAAKQRHTGRTLLIIGLIVLLILAALGAGALVANASLSSTYSPERAVTDYFAAQKRGDADFMIANANYLKGDGSYSQYFNRDELAVMLALPQNTDITNVKVTSTSVVDSNTSKVTVSMTWAGHQVQPALTVHRDLTRVHYQFFNSWLIDIPFVSIHVTAPNQAGAISVDGLPLPAGAPSDIDVIQGFHKVGMAATVLYDSVAVDADGIASTPTVVFPSTISKTAKADAVTSIKAAFKNCNVKTYTDCINHTYFAPTNTGFFYFFTMPGYGEVDYVKYVWTLTKDPTLNMKLVIGIDPGKISASGICYTTMTVDGTRTYKFKGTWTATMTASPGNFGSLVTSDCATSKA